MVAIFKRQRSYPYFKKPSIIFQPFPKALTGRTPRSIMGSKWWNKEKKNAILDNNYCCHACGVNVNDAEIHKRLEAFPIYEKILGATGIEYKGCAALCHLCYCSANYKTSAALFNKGFMSADKFDLIWTHRNLMFVKSGFIESEVFPIKNWNEWFLKIEGQVYFSKFKNEEACDNFYLTNQPTKEGDTNGN